MKTLASPLLLTGSAFSALLLAGCAGYNNTLFMTKSNVGLDFDSKPPTLEVSVSRKEAVIAPSFEGGETPPVLASFKPHGGNGGGFANFFLGVDQTFAGGDAAKAMAVLYEKPTATDPNPYDSSLKLSKKPDYRNPFQKIPSEGSTRPFIFGTDTSLGFKVAWSGTGGQIPDTVRLGFNRKEFAWAPLSATPVRKADGTDDSEKVNVKMPAFLATIESKQDVSGDASTRAQALQYFATGQAATYLAMKQEVRRAMLARLDPNTSAFADKFPAQGADVIPDILFSMEAVLGRYADRNDATAKELQGRLGSLANLDLPANYYTDEIPVYVFDDSTRDQPFLKKNDAEPQPLPDKSLRVAIGYLSTLEASHRNLTNAINSITQGQPVRLQAATNPPITAAMIPPLIRDAEQLKNRSQKLIEQLASNPDVQAAYDFVQRKLNP